MKRHNGNIKSYLKLTKLQFIFSWHQDDTDINETNGYIMHTELNQIYNAIKHNNNKTGDILWYIKAIKQYYKNVLIHCLSKK